jgi:hypothetical protein
MNLKNALLREHSKEQCDKIVAYIGDDKKRFASLIDLFFHSDYRIVQRAAWPLSYCVRNHTHLIKPYFKKLLDYLGKKENPVAVIRNTMRLLQYVELPRRYHGRVMNTCFDFIQSNDLAPAIKAFSLTILQNMSKQYPEIIPELKLIISERWSIETPAFRSRAKRILGKHAPRE